MKGRGRQCPAKICRRGLLNGISLRRRRARRVWRKRGRGKKREPSSTYETTSVQRGLFWSPRGESWALKNKGCMRAKKAQGSAKRGTGKKKAGNRGYWLKAKETKFPNYPAKGR